MTERGTDVIIRNRDNCEVHVRPHIGVIRLKTRINVNSKHIIDIIMNNAYNKYNRQIIRLIAKE